MIKNYFISAWRNLTQNKLLGFINLFGLTIGLASALLVASFVSNEYNYDDFHTKKDRLYRLVKTVDDGKAVTLNVGSNIPQGPAFKQTIPEIEGYCRIARVDGSIYTKDNAFSDRITYADANFLTLFSFKLLSGNADKVLKEPGKILLTEESAIKYFGSTDVVGKVLNIGSAEKIIPHVVEGIIQDPPFYSSIKFGIVTNIEPWNKNNPDAGCWGCNYLQTFLLLKNPANYTSFEIKLQDVFNRNVPASPTALSNNKDVQKIRYTIQPVNDLHLKTQIAERLKNESFASVKHIGLLIKIAILILFIAGCNFVIISLAKSLHRKKEIGIRKVIGGKRKQLVMQFMAESFLLTFLSAPLALLLAWIMSPHLASFLNIGQGTIPISFNANFIISGLAILLLTGLLAGIYPSIILSGFKPLEILNNRLRFTNKNKLTKALIVLQFAISIFFVTATIIVNRQYDFLVNKDLGYKTSNVAIAYVPISDYSKSDYLKNMLLSTPGIEQATLTNSGDWGMTTNMKLADGQEQEAQFQFVDETFIHALDVPLSQGKNFSGQSTDSAVCLVNESFVKETHMGSPVNQKITFREKDYNIIGVMKDCQFTSLKSSMKAGVLFKRSPGQFGEFFVKYEPSQKKEIRAILANVIKKAYPTLVPAITTLDERIERQYQAEGKIKDIASFCAIICILLSCTGLYGLVSLSLQYRVKEIGIRKVLGASVSNITTMIANNFLTLVLIGSLIALPLAWLLTNKWLQDFAYRIPVSWWLFGLAVLIVLLIAFVTIVFQTIKTAMGNPVNSLRNE
jgi:putative ABC transport system permease protein